MNRDAMLQKMEEVLASMRTALEQNDGSTLKALLGKVRAGIDMARMGFFQNENARKLIDDTKQCMDELEQSIIKGDRELSRTLLDRAGQLLEDFRRNAE